MYLVVFKKKKFPPIKMKKFNLIKFISTASYKVKESLT